VDKTKKADFDRKTAQKSGTLIYGIGIKWKEKTGKISKLKPTTCYRLYRSCYLGYRTKVCGDLEPVDKSHPLETEKEHECTGWGPGPILLQSKSISVVANVQTFL